MHSVEIFPYNLFPKGKLGNRASIFPRKGALFRITFQSGEVGYGDCFPWPEFGDLNIQSQLNEFENGRLTPLLNRTFEFAKIDAKARIKNRFLFDSLFIPKSHALCTDYLLLNEKRIQEFYEMGYREIKIKMGSNLNKEIDCLNEIHPYLVQMNIKLRLDFNSILTQEELNRFLELTEPLIERIDWIEDPFPYESRSWAKVQNDWKIRLALDRMPQIQNLEEGGFSVLILKPAVQDPNPIIQLAKALKVSLCVTSYLDHPFGQSCAAWVAAVIKDEAQVALETCGLTSHLAYEPHPFSTELNIHRAVLQPSPGTGFGFDHLLPKMDWRFLIRR